MDPAFDAAIAIIDRHLDECEPSGPQPEARIERAENLLGFRLPTSYRSFVAKYGALSFGPYQFYGIYKDELETGPASNMVWLSLDDRAKGVLPDTMIEFYFDGGVSYYVLDTAEGDDPPVRIWTPGMSQPPTPSEIVTSTFGEFLLETVTAEFGDG